MWVNSAYYDLSGEDKINVIVELGKMSEGPEGKFARVTAWLDARSDVEGWRSGPLFDLWYGDYEDIDDLSEQRIGKTAR